MKKINLSKNVLFALIRAEEFKLKTSKNYSGAEVVTATSHRESYSKGIRLEITAPLRDEDEDGEESEFQGTMHLPKIGEELALANPGEVYSFFMEHVKKQEITEETILLAISETDEEEAVEEEEESEAQKAERLERSLKEVEEVFSHPRMQKAVVALFEPIVASLKK